MKARILVGLALLLICVLAVQGWRATHAPQAAKGGVAAPVEAARPLRNARPAPEHQGERDTAPTRLSRAVVTRDPALAHGAFAGRVLSWATGAAVARAELSFARGGVLSSVTSDEGGRFVFVPDGDGAYALAVANAAGYLPYAPELGQSPIAFEARPGVRVADITVFMMPAVDYVGLVEGPDGKPIAGAQVRLFNAASGDLSMLGLTDHFVSDKQGEFRFHAPNDALFEATHPRFSPGRALLDRGAQGSRRLVLALGALAEASAPLATISGKVITANDEPVPGAFVSADMEDRDGRALVTRPSAISGGDGSFVLRDVDPGTYVVSVTHAELTSVSVEHVAAGVQDLRITLALGAELRGRVIANATRQPIPAASVAVLQADGAFTKETVKTVSVLDAEGHYRIRGIAPGDYSVMASAYGFAPSAEYKISVSGESVTQDIALNSGGSLSGTIIDRKTHRPIADARISLATDMPDGSSPLPFVANTSTDAAGHFLFAGLAVGRQSIEIVAEGHHSRMLGGIEVVGDEALPALTIEMTPTKPDEVPRLEVAGIGCALGADKDVITVTAVLPGSGAEQAKMQVGDTILQVDGTPVEDLGMNGTIQRLRGAEGTSVQIRIKQKASGAVATVVAYRIPVQF